MNHDVAVVAEILETKDFRGAVKAGLKPDMLGDRAALYYDVLSEYYQEHLQVPSVEFFKDLCPDYEHHPTGDSVQMLVEELKTLKLGTDLNELLRDLVEKNGIDPWEAKKRLVTAADQINSQHQIRNTRTQVGEKKEYVLDMLRQLRGGSGMLGLPWAFPTLNDRTPGILPGNVIYFYGRHKSKKTWIMLFMALFYELMGFRVLFFTREMSVEELHFRLAALILAISIDDFSKGRVTDDEVALVDEIMTQIYDRGRFHISDNTDGIEGYRAEIEDFQPDIVFHDYWKAMADDAMGDKYGTSEKRYVDRTIDLLVNYHAKVKIPSIICGHANREGDKSKGKSSVEHAWSDHIARRIHAAIRVVKSNDEKFVGLVINAGRAIPEDVLITLDGNLCFNFGEELDVDSGWIFSSEDAKSASNESEKKMREDTVDPKKIPVGKRAFKAVRRRKTA